MKNIPGFYSLLLFLIITVAACHDRLPEAGELSNTTRSGDFNATDVLYRSGGIHVQKMDGKFHVVYRSADADKVKREVAKVGAGISKVVQKAPISRHTTGSIAEQVTSRAATVEGNAILL